MISKRRFRYRKAIRLKGYDYHTPGSYFVTLNCKNRAHLFGEIENGVMHLNAYGKLAFKEWYRTAEIRPHIKLGAFTIMPDHLHGIIIIKDRDERNNPHPSCFTLGKFISPSDTLGAIIRGYMGAVTRQINELRQTPNEKVWQRNYWDHIIRNKKEYYKITSYIIYNPKNWNG